MSTVVPQTQFLGNRKLYESLLGTVFASGGPVLAEDVRSYCLASHYRVGSQVDGALQLLLNIGILKPDGNSLIADQEFLKASKNGQIALEVSRRLIDRLCTATEINGLFPPGSLSWGRSDGELDVHLSQIPIRNLPIVKLLRDLDVFLDSDQADILLKVESPFSDVLREAMSTVVRHGRRVKTLSPEQLKKLLEMQEKQGGEAEEFLLARERKRLHGHRQLDLVSRISLKNTAAGYDIDSFEGMNSFFPDRFIEVKSYRGIRHFFLSAEELDAARDLAEHYYLCVVDMDQINNEAYLPVVIKNPAVKLFDASTDWSGTPVSFEFTHLTSENQD